MPEEDYIDEPLTELQQDQADTGWFYFLATPEAYPALAGYVDQSRGYPIGGAKAATLHGLPPAEELLTTTDGSGQLMLRLATWRVTSDDLSALQPYIEQGALSIVTELEWLSLKPEDEDLLPDLEPQISLSSHCSKQIDDLLGESMSMEVNGKIFTSQDHASSTYVRNPDLWCGDLDITCASPWNSSGGHKKAGTLVTPRHVIGAAHYEYSVGAVVRFVEKDGTVHDRTVAGKARHPESTNYHPDLTIYTLDSDLPDTIKPCYVMPSDYATYLANEQVKTACLGLDQEEKALIIDWNSGGRMRTPTDPNRLIFHENKISGDSGNPAFLIVDEELVLMTVWTWGGAGAGTPIADYISDINTMISTADTQAGVSTNYTVTEADFSTFPQV